MKKRSAASPCRAANSPGAKRTLAAHPTIRSRCSGFIPSKRGIVARTGLSVSVTVCLLGMPGPSERLHLFGEVDACRTPRDAATAADTAGHAELLRPGRELVREPLAVARPDRGPDASAVDVGEIRGEARVPTPGPHRLRSREIGRVFDGRAEAGRADHRAVPAGEAAARHVVPAGILVAPAEQLRKPFGVEPARLAACG